MRKYGVVQTSIWRDQEFLDLTPGAQRMYLALTTRPNITAAGTLPVTVRRWATLSKHTTEDDITTALDELADARFIVIDHDTEELLVRSFVRWDGGANNPKRQPAIYDAAGAVESSTIRDALAVEFERVGLPIDRVYDDPSNTPSNRQSDSHPDTHTDSHGVVVTAVPPTTSTHNPHSASLDPHSSTPKPNTAPTTKSLADLFAMPK